MKLSLTGGSGLPISALMECPQKFKHVMDGWSRVKTPMYFIDGNVFHMAAEEIITKKNKLLSSIEGVNEYCSKIYDEGRFWDDRKERWVEFNVEELAYPNKPLKNGELSPITKADHSKKMMVQLLFQVHLAAAEGRFEDVTDTEVYVQTELVVNPTTGEPDKVTEAMRDMGIIVCGRLDMEQKGDVKAADLKTTKADLGRLAKLYQNQFALYGYLKTLKDGELCQKFGIHGFKKNVTQSAYEYEELELTIADYMEIFKLLRGAGRQFMSCVENDEWEKRGHFSCGCRDSFNQICPYHPLCFPGKHTKEEIELLVKEEKNV